MPNVHDTQKLLASIPTSIWQQLERKTVFFGHQSVGNNIINGMKRVLQKNQAIKLEILETNSPHKFSRPLFSHFKVGKNLDPLSKNSDFSIMINNGIGEIADIAFYKYCYVDVNDVADALSLFSSYSQNMTSLKKTYPLVTFVHVTVPLTVVQKGPRAWLKKVISRKIGGYADNINRNKFNTLMSNYYKGKEPIFDLARIESTYPDGSRETFHKNGKTYYSLVHDYTLDGRHLNDQGSKFVAEHLLILLAELNNKKSD